MVHIRMLAYVFRLTATATATAKDLKRKRSYNVLNQMMLHLVIRGRGWYLSISKAHQSFSHVQVVPPVALCSIYISIPMHI